jgi:hypothetical protein
LVSVFVIDDSDADDVEPTRELPVVDDFGRCANKILLA